MGYVEGGALHTYRRNLANVAPLDRELERDLTRRWRAGDERAGETLITACLPFVISIALEYRRWGIPLEDIIQQGNVGLLRAAKKFDPEKACRLATYAAYWIRAEIREYVVRGYRLVRLGTTKAERRALRAYRTGQGSDAEGIAAVSGLSVERAERLLPLLAAREASLDASSSDAGPAVDRLSSDGPSPESEAAAGEARAMATSAVTRALEGLSPRERLIVRERMMADAPRTLESLGATLGVSKERVRQIEERIRGKLQAELAPVALAVA